MKQRKKIAVAMSGGVDSSVAASLLKEEGHQVLGITMGLFPDHPKHDQNSSRHRFVQDAAEDASRIAGIIGIPHRVVDLRKDFEEKVIDNFSRSYSRGMTPNPCILCNQAIKFDALRKKAAGLGYPLFATGHHARITHDSQTDEYRLRKGKDLHKDQSYFLYRLAQEQLACVSFPVGGLTKAQIRKMAVERGLPVAQRPESQEICFIPDNDYVRFLEERDPSALQPGEIVSTDGEVLGLHGGIARFTIGQRRGLGIASAHPLYVLEIDPEHNRIVVGTNAQLYKPALSASSVHLISGKTTDGSLKVKAKIRYKHKEAQAKVIFLPGDRAHVDFETPQRAVTPGQAVVFYEKDAVMGGGIIEDALDE